MTFHLLLNIASFHIKAKIEKNVFEKYIWNFYIFSCNMFTRNF